MNKALLHAETIPAQPWFEAIDLLSRHNIYFETCLANTPALAETAYRIRYQVYCVERGFESAQEHATGLETDAYDNRSLAGLLIHRPSGDAMGTVRLVLPDFSAPGVFPVEANCCTSNGIERWLITCRWPRPPKCRASPSPRISAAAPATTRRLVAPASAAPSASAKATCLASA